MSEQTTDPETPYEASEEDTNTTERRGKLFFGICDMRVATVATNVLNILIIAIGTLFHLIKFFGFMPLQACIPPVVLSAIAIFGAVNFENWAVYMAAGGFLIGLLVDLWWFNIFGIIMGCLVLYATGSLGHQMYKGIITKDTYQEREEFINMGMVERSGIDTSYLTNFHETLKTGFGGFGGKREEAPQS